MSAPGNNGFGSDQTFWWKICRPAIEGLIDHAGTYTPDEKASNLNFFAKHVCPWLGPQPKAACDEDSSPLDVCSPVEASINFSTRGKTIVRFQFEPLGATTGPHVTSDAFGKARVAEFLSGLERELQATGVDLRWTGEFTRMLVPTEATEIARVQEAEKAGLPYPLDHALTFNVAFDLDGACRKMKGYFMPQAKSLATGLPADKVSFQAIRNLRSAGEGLVPAVDFLERYFTVCPDKLTVDMIGHDCADPTKARIKLYAHLQTLNSWNAIRHVVTFGGLATDEPRRKGLEILHDIWHFLRDDTTGNQDDDWNKPMVITSSFLGSVMFSFEMMIGNPIPEVKIYVPLWQYARSDRVIAKNLSAVFRRLGWDEVADNYLQNLQHCFPGADLDGPAVIHSNLSFSYSEKTGEYMTVYYAVHGKATGALAAA